MNRRVRPPFNHVMTPVEPKKKILIIEDDLDLSKMLKLRLEKDGYAVVQAFGGYEGLYKYIKEKPNLIILDIMLPQLDGYEICREIRRELKDPKTPIIMLTAKNQDYDRIKGKVVGTTKYFTKPFDGKDILQGVKDCLS